jgi:hypothetical protein
MRDKLKTICYVFHMIWTHVWLSLFHYSWSFVRVSFHVITWLLSSYCQDYVFHAHILSSFDPSTQCLLRWSRLWWCMSPQKLFFCYHLPTRGRAGVKLGDAWYVSNVSRCHSASSLFSAVFVFQKSYTGNILGIGRNKSRTSYFYRSFAKTEDETEGGHRPATPQGGVAQALAMPTHGEATWSTSWWRPFAYKVPSTGKT